MAALELILGIILLRSNPRKSPINKAVAAFSFFSSAFSFFTAIMYIRASLGLEFVLAAKVTWVAWLSIPAALQFIYYLKDEKSPAARLIGLVLYPFWSIILLISVSTNWIVAGPYTLIPYVYNAGPLDHPARIVAGSLILWLIAEIYLLRRKVSGIKKAQLDYFFFGTLIFAGGGAVMGAFLQLFGGASFDPTLSSYFSFVWLLLTFYAIIRYRLFDIPLILSRTIGIGIFLGIFTAIHVVLFKLLEPVLGETSADLISFSAMGLVLFGTPLTQSLQDRINNIVLKRRYNYQQILKESSRAVITILDLDLLLNYLINSIKRSMEVEIVHLFMKAENGDYTTRHGTPQQGPQNIEKDIIQMIKGAPLVIIRDELENSPPGEESGRLLAVMTSIESDILIPLLYKGELNGILTLGKKGSSGPYIQSDIDLLQALAGHASVAIENARLYEEAKWVKKSLQESEQKFRTLAETINAAIVIYRQEKFLYVNPATASLTGYTSGEFLEMDFSLIIHPAYLGIVRERALARLQGKPVPSQYEFKIIRKDGEERWVLATAGRIEYGREPATIAAFLDITDLKQAEEDRALFYEESLRQYQEKIDEEKKHQSEIEKILMDIHDGIGGITTNISLLAEMAQKASSPAEVTSALVTISSLSRDGMGEIRSLMRSLDSKDLSWASLIAELRSLGTSMVVPHAIAFEMTPEVEKADDRPGSILCLNLFRIYREALTNIIKHAKATRVRVNFHIDSECLVLMVHDNGRGSGKTALPGKGRGVSNMKTRTAEIGGTFTITTDEGTSVRVEVPLSVNSPRSVYGASENSGA